MNYLFQQKKEQIIRGRNLWTRLGEKYRSIQKKYVFLFPEEASESAPHILCCLPEFIRKKDIDLFYVLYCGQESVRKSEALDGAGCVKIEVSDQEIEDILAYYMFEEFSEKIVVAGFDFPDGRNGSQIIGVRSITAQEVISLGILKM